MGRRSGVTGTDSEVPRNAWNVSNHANASEVLHTGASIPAKEGTLLEHSLTHFAEEISPMLCLNKLGQCQIS